MSLLLYRHAERWGSFKLAAASAAEVLVQHLCSTAGPWLTKTGFFFFFFEVLGIELREARQAL
jgi:hypothetical protein